MFPVAVSAERRSQEWCVWVLSVFDSVVECGSFVVYCGQCLWFVGRYRVHRINIECYVEWLRVRVLFDCFLPQRRGVGRGVEKLSQVVTPWACPVTNDHFTVHHFAHQLITTQWPYHVCGVM